MSIKQTIKYSSNLNNIWNLPKYNFQNVRLKEKLHIEV